MSDERHTIVVERREKATINGVKDIISFDEEIVAAKTSMGVLIIKGEDLHMSNLNLESGNLALEGTIDSMEYEDADTYNKPAASIFGKIFK